jgi:hypothetical protein
VNGFPLKIYLFKLRNKHYSLLNPDSYRVLLK